jgi:hypothetical protein
MPLTRLLVVALLATPLSAFAQSEAKLAQPAPDLFAPHTNTQPATSEPWRIIPDNASKTASSRDSFSAQQASQAHPDSPDQLRNWILEDIPDPPATSASDAPTTNIPVPAMEAFNSDNTCYAIRSYVVARDDKDSDSTHLVHYSTCQPAARYRLRTTEIETQSPAR